MSFRNLAIGFLLTGCAGAGREAAAPSTLLIHASHYQSMVGVQVMSSDGEMTCNRGTITGSHVMRWYCRSAGDPMPYQLGGPVALVLR